MQSFTTQSHERNYQGNVIFQMVQNTKAKRHRLASIIATVCLACTIMVTGTLLGVMTVHNQQLKHEIKTLETQSTQVQSEQLAEDCIQCNATYEPNKKRGKTLPHIPISNQQQDTEPMPSVENTLH